MSASTNTLTASFIESKKLWYPDGSIVIQAEQTGWRVHRFLLAERAGGFIADLVSAAVPGELYQEVPLLRTHDTAEEMGVFLQALYDSGNFRANREEPEGIYQAMMLIKIASKYCADGMLSWAKRPIERLYGAQTLDQYLSITVPELNSCQPPILFKASTWTHIRIINLARRCHLPERLPLAFYFAARAITTKDALYGCEIPNSLHTVKFEHQEDVERCLEGRLRLVSLFHPYTYFRFRPDNKSPNCPDRKADRRNCNVNPFCFNQRPRGGANVPVVGCATVPMEEIGKDIDALAGSDRICDICADNARKLAKFLQQEMWDALPAIFDLPVRSTSSI